MKDSSSPHCLIVLSRSTSLFIITLLPYIQNNTDTTIWFAGSVICFNIQVIIILAFKWFSRSFCLASASSSSSSFNIYLVLLQSNSFSTTSLPSAAHGEQERILNSLISLTFFLPFAFQILSLIYLSPFVSCLLPILEFHKANWNTVCVKDTIWSKARMCY